ncbi:hypothetical protein WME90_29585 [Sorangium sp. So ce375]|uniref:hypothetical protein n=1 Tax=Sorangium sp. So ce375 TaxID=3133306 RepID=UPI003F5BE445
MRYAARVLAAPPPPRLSRPARLLAAALLAVSACQPAPTPPARASQDAATRPVAAGAATPTPQDGAPAPQPAPHPRGDAQPALVAAGDAAAGTALDSRSPVRLPPPPFGQALFRRAPAGGSAAPRLVKVAEKKNQITDQAAWFTTNGLSLPMITPAPSADAGGESAPLPSFVPERYRDQALVKAIGHGDHLALFYGPSFAEARFVAILDKAHTVVAFFDFESFLMPPEFAPKEAGFVKGQVGWAEVDDGVLYISSGHRTYAASSKGKNAYLSAIDLASGQLLWQSAPLVCNAENFLLRGDHLLCGYGFTAEPDFLYVLERATGKVVSKLPLKSGPEFLVEKDGKLFVRTYDTDYVFEIR